MRDPYVVLGVSLEATDEEIRSAFRLLALKWHPDHNPNNKKEAEEKFNEITYAYSVLSDQARRPATSSGGVTIRDDLLASFFFAKSTKKPMNVRGGITLTLPQAMIGGRFSIGVPSYKRAWGLGLKTGTFWSAGHAVESVT
jgi:hypothetical protein